jgi:hypothetical protein
MADVQKPVAAEPVAETVVAAPAAETTPVVEATVADAETEVKADEPAKAEESKESAPVKEEAKPIYEGPLQYNAGSNPLKYVCFFALEQAVTNNLLQVIDRTQGKALLLVRRGGGYCS